MDIKWKKDVEEHDYPSAYNYLNLLFDDNFTNKLVARLKNAQVIEHRANDILRASSLPLLPINDVSVSRDVEKVMDGEKLSPVLLVKINGKLHIADGYHRICAIVSHDPRAMIRCKLVNG